MSKKSLDMPIFYGRLFARVRASACRAFVTTFFARMTLTKCWAFYRLDNVKNFLSFLLLGNPFAH